MWRALWKAACSLPDVRCEDDTAVHPAIYAFSRTSWFNLYFLTGGFWNEPAPGEGLQELNYLSWHCSSQGHPRGGTEEPDVYTRSSKRGLVAGHSNVTAGNQLTPSSSSQAIHHGNDRDRVILDQHHDLKEQTHPVHIQPRVRQNTNASISYEFTVSECFPYASLYQILWKMGKRRPKEN